MKYKFTTKQLEQIERCRWLTDRERRIFNLYYRRGWFVEDIAAELYCSTSVVKRALRSIRQKWSESDT